MQYHIGLDSQTIKNAKYAILPGDPGRVEKIAAFLENGHKVGQNREYTSYVGYIEQTPVLVMSTGMGGPSTAIGLEELAAIGVTTVIRVGTSGGMQTDVLPGDLIIVQGAIRQEGTSKEYLPVEFPAIADFSVTTALKQAADKLEMHNHVGIVQCKDSFYGQHDPARMPVGDELLYKWKAWIRGGALASEMETAALYITASVLRLRAGAVMLCIWNQERENLGLAQEQCHDTGRAIRTAIEAMATLIKADRA